MPSGPCSPALCQVFTWLIPSKSSLQMSPPQTGCHWTAWTSSRLPQLFPNPLNFFTTLTTLCSDCIYTGISCLLLVSPHQKGSSWWGDLLSYTAVSLAPRTQPATLFAQLLGGRASSGIQVIALTQVSFLLSKQSMAARNTGFATSERLARVLVMPRSNHVSVSKPVHLSDPQFPHL